MNLTKTIHLDIGTDNLVPLDVTAFVIEPQPENYGNGSIEIETVKHCGVDITEIIDLHWIAKIEVAFADACGEDVR